jgi:hypothetical protein
MISGWSLNQQHRSTSFSVIGSRLGNAWLATTSRSSGQADSVGCNSGVLAGNGNRSTCGGTSKRPLVCQLARSTSNTSRLWPSGSTQRTHSANARLIQSVFAAGRSSQNVSFVPGRTKPYTRFRTESQLVLLPSKPSLGPSAPDQASGALRAMALRGRELRPPDAVRPGQAADGGNLFCAFQGKAAGMVQQVLRKAHSPAGMAAPCQCRGTTRSAARSWRSEAGSRPPGPRRGRRSGRCWRSRSRRMRGKHERPEPRAAMHGPWEPSGGRAVDPRRRRKRERAVRGSPFPLIQTPAGDGSRWVDGACLGRVDFSRARNGRGMAPSGSGAPRLPAGAFRGGSLAVRTRGGNSRPPYPWNRARVCFLSRGQQEPRLMGESPAKRLDGPDAYETDRCDGRRSGEAGEPRRARRGRGVPGRWRVALPGRRGRAVPPPARGRVGRTGRPRRDPRDRLRPRPLAHRRWTAPCRGADPDALPWKVDCLSCERFVQVRRDPRGAGPAR